MGNTHRRAQHIVAPKGRLAGLLLLTMLVIVPLLAACGGDDASAPAPTTTTGSVSPSGDTASVTATSGPDATPTEGDTPPTESATEPSGASSDTLMGFSIEEAANTGGTFIEGSAADLQTVNPVIANDTPSANFLALIFESLIELHPETMEPVGALAEAWEVSDDGLTWTFTLRDDVEWHDGEGFSADDVAFTYELHMNEESNSSYGGDLLAKIASIEVVDPQTVAFTLPQPYADFAVDVAVYSIIPEHIWAGVAPADVINDPGSTGEDAARVVGTGPFVFEEWVTNDHATATANESYWAGAPHLDEYIYKVVPDSTAAIQQLHTGEIDWFADVPGSAVAELEGADVDITVSETTNFMFYGYNLDETQTPLFQEPAVRQALLYALDRDAMVDALLEGYGVVAIGTMPILSWAYNPDEIESPYPYEPELARTMLDEAGWVLGSDGVREKDGERLAFTMHVDSSSPEQVAYVT
ncbi:MAG: ABC transporter substrate-binding protein, partial [Chloroflexota bacterium]|nr:ABC transporter substrate-binding protein [Chloroflexota bacterium]